MQICLKTTIATTSNKKIAAKKSSPHFYAASVSCTLCFKMTHIAPKHKWKPPKRLKSLISYFFGMDSTFFMRLSYLFFQIASIWQKKNSFHDKIKPRGATKKPICTFIRFLMSHVEK